MSDKEADKFNNINLSSDSDQDVKSKEEEPNDVTSLQDSLKQQTSSRKSLRRSRRQKRANHTNRKIEARIIPTKKKRNPRKKEYKFHEITFKRSDPEIKASRYKGPCYCKSQTTKCIKLTEQDRRAIFEHVKSLPIDWRYGYVSELVRRLPIKGKYAMKTPLRKRSWVVYFHLTKMCGTILPVCKTMFLNTTGLTASFVHKSLIKKELQDSQSMDPESLHLDADNDSRKFRVKNELPGQCHITKNEPPDLHDLSPSHQCQFDDQNNPIVPTTGESHSRTLHKKQSECVNKISALNSSHFKETLDADHDHPLPSTMVVAEAPEINPVKSLESSHLDASFVNCDKSINNTLQSMNMNHDQFINEQMWLSRHNKTPRDLGQSYITKRGKFVPARKLKDRCSCRSIITKCNQFTDDDRQAVFEYVWSLSKDEKKDFISDYVERTPVKRKRESSSKKEWTFQFYLRKVSGEVITVCKKMFMKTTSLTSFLIRTVVAKKDSNYATMIEPGSLFYSKFSHDDDQHNSDIDMDESPEPFIDPPSLVCHFDDQNNPIVVTSWESKLSHCPSDNKALALKNGDEGPSTDDDSI